MRTYFFLKQSILLCIITLHIMLINKITTNLVVGLSHTGAYILNDFTTEFNEKKVTISIQSHLPALP